MDLEDLRQGIDDRLRKARFCAVGVVQSYNATTRLAEVQPVVDEKYADATTLEAPVITGVPVLMPSTSSAGLSLPIGSGDPVLLLHADRSLDRWIATGSRGVPGDTRMHAMSDAVAVAGLFPSTVSHSDGSGLLLYNAAIKLRMYQDKVAIGTAVAELLDEITKAFDEIATLSTTWGAVTTQVQASSAAIKSIMGSI